jgi:hypothetical protein
MLGSIFLFLLISPNVSMFKHRLVKGLISIIFHIVLRHYVIVVHVLYFYLGTLELLLLLVFCGNLFINKFK